MKFCGVVKLILLKLLSQEVPSCIPTLPDIRHPRRALTTDELNLLFETTAKGSKHHRMTGKERVMLYTIAVSTGFVSLSYLAVV